MIAPATPQIDAQLDWAKKRALQDTMVMVPVSELKALKEYCDQTKEPKP